MLKQDMNPDMTIAWLTIYGGVGGIVFGADN